MGASATASARRKREAKRANLRLSMIFMTMKL
jgi:hypothetical protein